MAPRKAKTAPEVSALEAGAINTDPVAAAAEFQTEDLFSFNTEDSKGAVVDQTLMGRTFKHQRNEKDYKVVGFCFLATSDEWGVLLMERYVGHPVAIARPQVDVTSNFEDGTPRYVEVL